jgi:hypothetical protein
MSEEEFDIHWEGRSGREYGYWILPLADRNRLIQAPGNFILAKKTKSGIWDPVFIGEARDLGSNFLDPDTLECALKANASHIHVHTSGDEQEERLQEVKDLCRLWAPDCNG